MSEIENKTVTTYKFHFWAPIVNYIGSEDKFELSKNIQIVRTSELQYEKLKKFKKKWSGFNISDWVIKITLEKEHPENEPNEFSHEIRQVVECIITILRLYHDYSIGYQLIFQEYSDPPSHAHNVIGFYHYTLWTPVTASKLKGNYYLREEEYDEFKQLYDLYHTKLSKLNLAIDFFNKSYHEPYPFRDGFIDCMIALENIFLKGIHQELGYRLSIRMSHILAKNSQERKELFSYCKKAYSTRSKILHGEQSDGLSEDGLLRIRELLRKAILYFMINPQHRINNNIEEIIFQGSFYPDHKLEN